MQRSSACFQPPKLPWHRINSRLSTSKQHGMQRGGVVCNHAPGSGASATSAAAGPCACGQPSRTSGWHSNRSWAGAAGAAAGLARPPAAAARLPAGRAPPGARPGAAASLAAPPASRPWPPPPSRGSSAPGPRPRSASAGPTGARGHRARSRQGVRLRRPWRRRRQRPGHQDPQAYLRQGQCQV